MNRRPTDCVRDGEGLVLDFFGHVFDFRRSDEVCCVMIDAVPPGQGVHLHVHDAMDEHFYVLDGAFRFGLGDETMDAGPGDYLHAERGTPHGFRCVSKAPGRLLCVSLPGGFEEFCRAVLDAVRAKGMDPATLAAVAARFGTRFVGPVPE